MLNNPFWWWLFTSLGGYLVIGAIASVVLVTFGNFRPFRDASEAMRFFWCATTHQRWHVVQHERPTLTRLYCTKCGHVHLKLKRKEDRGKPTKLPG